MKALRLLTLLSFIAYPFTAFADVSACSDLDVHCSHFINAPFPKYIKVEFMVNGHPQKPFFICADKKTAITIDKEIMEAGVYTVGSVLSYKYMQCETKSCKHSIRIGEEAFTLKRAYDDSYYYSDPYRYAITLNAGYGDYCEQDNNKLRIRGNFPIS